MANHFYIAMVMFHIEDKHVCSQVMLFTLTAPYRQHDLPTIAQQMGSNSAATHLTKTAEMSNLASRDESISMRPLASSSTT